MRLLSIALGLVGGALLPHLVHAQAVDDPFSDYLQRGQTIAIGAGNDNEANEAIQTITPWPPYVGDRRIPMSGRRAVDAIQQLYRVPDPFAQQGSGAAASGAGSPASGAQGGTSPTGLPVTPMQPLSSGY